MFHYEQIQKIIVPKLAAYKSMGEIKQDIQKNLKPDDFITYQNDKASAFFNDKECDFLEQETPSTDESPLPFLIHEATKTKTGTGLKIPRDASNSFTDLQVDMSSCLLATGLIPTPETVVLLNFFDTFETQREKFDTFLQQKANRACSFICTIGTGQFGRGPGHHFLLVLVKFGPTQTLGLIVMDSCTETGHEISSEAQIYVDRITQAINKPRLLS